MSDYEPQSAIAEILKLPGLEAFSLKLEKDPESSKRYRIACSAGRCGDAFLASIEEGLLLGRKTPEAAIKQVAMSLLSALQSYGSGAR